MKRFALLIVLALPLVASPASRERTGPQGQVRAGDRELTASLDVKDEEVRPILKSLQQQCAVKNLIIDKEVEGRGTFLFRDVPCSVAFKTVLATFGLTYEGDPTLMQVKRR